MARTSQETIDKINELYLVYGVKSKVAKELNISPSTVSKYIIPDYQPKAITNAKSDNTWFDTPLLLAELEDLGKLCELTEQEWADMKILQKEVL